ncbi:MAG: YbjN domain-containing protein [Micromonosporaceae bacterium]|nr:YbjN domain-containing protein [Micromonosporaceae bacterium]
MARVAGALKRLGIRHLTDEDGNLLAMWEKHVVLFVLEGPDREVLVMRARAYTALPPEWADRAYGAVNEWNHTRRFLKSYVGDETESGRLSLYAETQLPLAPGLHDGLLDELIDCAAAVSGSWANWLHDEGALL